ncbi:MexH family multidrug efflux RND transporter periplasmic adaptor subunit [Desulfatiferula olefinivorans]
MRRKNTTAGPRSKKGSVLPIIITVFVMIVLGVCCQAKSDRLQQEKKAARKEDAPAINVVTMAMEPRTIRDRLSLPGSFTPSTSLTVASEVSGMIMEKRVEKGTRVQAGELLALVDDTKYKNAYNAAKANYENALSSKERLETLYRSDLSNKTDLDAVTAQMKNQLAAMRVAAVDLEKCRITAPVPGLVNRIFIEQGQFMDMGNPVMEIIRTDPIYFNVNIPESDVHAVRFLKTFDIRVDALEGRVVRANARHLTRTAGSLARAYDLELTVDNPDGDILPDMFGRVSLVKRTVENALAVPLYAVVSINDKKIVYLAEKNPRFELIEAALAALGLPDQAPVDTAVSREVTTGIQDGWMVEITTGLSAGDQVITVGQRSVSDGQKIHIIRSRKEQEELLR